MAIWLRRRGSQSFVEPIIICAVMNTSGAPKRADEPGGNGMRLGAASSSMSAPKPRSPSASTMPPSVVSPRCRRPTEEGLIGASSDSRGGLPPCRIGAADQDLVDPPPVEIDDLEAPSLEIEAARRFEVAVRSARARDPPRCDRRASRAAGMPRSSGSSSTGIAPAMSHDPSSRSVAYVLRRSFFGVEGRRRSPRECRPW